MQTWMRPAAGAVAAVAVLALAGPALAACPGDRSVPTAANAPDTVAALICDLNEIRARNGLTALSWDARLARLAQRQASDMARAGALSHTDSDGRDLATRAAASGYLVGIDGIVLENLAWGDGGSSSPRAIADLWMQSGMHRDNLLDPRVTNLAVAVARPPSSDRTGGTYYVAEFGTPGSPSAGTLQTSGKRDVREGEHGRRVHRKDGKRGAVRKHRHRVRTHSVALA